MEFTGTFAFLTHPLTLFGGALLVFSAIHYLLIGTGVLKPGSNGDERRAELRLPRHGLFIALVAIAMGLVLKTMGWPSPSAPPASFAQAIDSYEQAKAFADFIHAHEGQAVYINVMIDKPFWDQSDCDFMLWTASPEDPHEEPSIANSSGEMYCIQDEHGDFVNPEKPTAGYLLTEHRDLLRFEGFFSVIGDIEGGHQGVWPVGLVPLPRDTGH